MKCPKCGYTGFDYLDSCKRCGGDLRDTRSLLQIIAVSPDGRAPSGGPAPVAPSHPEAARGAPSAVDFSDLDAESLAPPQSQAMLEDLDFDQSFADMVETTGHAPDKGSKEADDDALLDLDFGDVFGEKSTKAD